MEVALQLWFATQIERWAVNSADRRQFRSASGLTQKKKMQTREIMSRTRFHCRFLDSYTNPRAHTHSHIVCKCCIFCHFHIHYSFSILSSNLKLNHNVPKLNDNLTWYHTCLENASNFAPPKISLIPPQNALSSVFELPQRGSLVSRDRQ